MTGTDVCASCGAPARTIKVRAPRRLGVKSGREEFKRECTNRECRTRDGGPRRLGEHA